LGGNVKASPHCPNFGTIPTILLLTAGCGGDPFVLVGDLPDPPDSGAITTDAKGDEDVLQEDSHVLDERRVDAYTASESDAQADRLRVAEAASDAADVVDGSDAVAEVGMTIEACAQVAAFTFGCGPPIYVNAPAQYCVLNQVANTAQTMPNPCVCDYSCACLLASGTSLCPGGESYQSCTIGTTGGMVVTCK
jgi:hypothetical protein